VFERLGEAGILVRRFADHPRWLRFGLPATQEAFARLRQALETFARLRQALGDIRPAPPGAGGRRKTMERGVNRDCAKKSDNITAPHEDSKSHAPRIAMDLADM
jgi:hypothetical protein